MKALRYLAIASVVSLVGLGGLEFGDRLGRADDGGLVAEAEARIGRPLTPVSVAGVARRTVRRCAVGVYDC